MKLFVTGASGYIGGSVASKLHDAGHEVLGLVRSEEKVVHWPGVTHPGSVCDLPVTGTDMMPTILSMALAGGAPTPCDGVDIVALVLGRPADWPLRAGSIDFRQ
jgi:uncharacterized protein YbjT (DUF2867 family)